jgi:hypothetical protein
MSPSHRRDGDRSHGRVAQRVRRPAPAARRRAPGRGHRPRLLAPPVRDEYRQACALLTPAAQPQIGRLGDGDCEAAVGFLALTYTPAEQRGLEHVTFRHVTVSGDRATSDAGDVQLPRSIKYMRRPNRRPTVLRRLDGKWLIEDLG